MTIMIKSWEEEEEEKKKNFCSWYFMSKIKFWKKLIYICGKKKKSNVMLIFSDSPKGTL